MILYQIIVNLNVSPSSKFNRTLIACYAAMRYLYTIRYLPTIRYSPTYTIKRYSSTFTIKRYSPTFTIKRYSSTFHCYIFADRRTYLITLFLIYLAGRFDCLFNNSSEIIMTSPVLLIILLKVIYSWPYAKTSRYRYRSIC